jgi:hypothetical protein
MNFYRAEYVFTGYYCDLTDTVGRHNCRICHILYAEFILDKETPKGYWIVPFPYGGKRKWISKTAKKRYAYPTKSEALGSLLRRKLREISLCKQKIIDAEIVVSTVETLLATHTM